MTFLLKVERFRHRDGETKWEQRDFREHGGPGLVRVSVTDPDNGEVLNAIDFPDELLAEAFVYGMEHRAGAGCRDRMVMKWNNAGSE
jgi:hypothetical protein